MTSGTVISRTLSRTAKANKAITNPLYRSLICLRPSQAKHVCLSTCGAGSLSFPDPKSPASPLSIVSHHPTYCHIYKHSPLPTLKTPAICWCHCSTNPDTWIVFFCNKCSVIRYLLALILYVKTTWDNTQLWCKNRFMKLHTLVNITSSIYTVSTFGSTFLCKKCINN